MSELENLVALVTGGSRGLGRVAAQALAGAGAKVVIAGRRSDTLAATGRAIEAETGRRVVPHACHVGRWEEVDELVDFAYAELGRVDVLVNNAGISPAYDELTDVTAELWHKVIDVNLSGPFRLSALIGSRMAAGDGGSIINVSSVAAEHPTADNLPYAAAKAGLNALTLGFARAFGPRVRVNAIVAGNFTTEMFAGLPPGLVGAEAAGAALQRPGAPGELAGTVLYLAGRASSYTTGALVHVDGGYQAPANRGAAAV